MALTLWHVSVPKARECQSTVQTGGSAVLQLALEQPDTNWTRPCRLHRHAVLRRTPTGAVTADFTGVLCSDDPCLKWFFINCEFILAHLLLVFGCLFLGRKQAY